MKDGVHNVRRRKERNVFNDALNTFYLRLFGVGHNMVKDHSGSERGNLLPSLHGNSFRLAARNPLYAPSYSVTPVVKHWLE